MALGESMIPSRIANLNGFETFEALCEYVQGNDKVLEYPDYLKTPRVVESFCVAVKAQDCVLHFDEQNNLIMSRKNQEDGTEQHNPEERP